MLFGINITPEEYLRRQAEHISDFLRVAVIADDHLVSGCGNTMEEVCKDRHNNLPRSLERAMKIGLRLISAKM